MDHKTMLETIRQGHAMQDAVRRAMSSRNPAQELIANLDAAKLGIEKGLRRHDHVEWMHERLMKQFAKFEANLSPDEELGGRIAALGSDILIHIESMGYWGPDLLILHGVTPDGKRVQLNQHMSQVSIMLVALPKMGPVARRMGFRSE